MSTRVAKPAAATPVDGWQESDWMYSSTSTTYFHSLYTVPKSPARNDGQTIYYFTSATAPNDDNTIIQPVLEYGMGADGGWSGQWSIDSWAVTDNSNFFFASPKKVNQGDTIYGSAFSKNCTAKAGCNWTIWTHDNTTGAAATLNTTADKRQYNTLQPGVLEAYYLKSCADFPQSAVTFSAVHFMVGSGEVKNGYTPEITDPVCGMAVTDNPSNYSTTMHVNGR